MLSSIRVRENPPNIFPDQGILAIVIPEEAVLKMDITYRNKRSSTGIASLSLCALPHRRQQGDDSAL
jgi:hypothetical protein